MSKIPKAGSPGEEALWLHLCAEKLDKRFIREYRFHVGRKWSADFACIAPKLLIEVEGGTWQGGRHSRGKGFENDCEKYNTATKEGWKLLRYSTEMVNRGDAINDVLELLR